MGGEEVGGDCLRVFKANTQRCFIRTLILPLFILPSLSGGRGGGTGGILKKDEE